jgi:TolB-like protein
MAKVIPPQASLISDFPSGAPHERTWMHAITAASVSRAAPVAAADTQVRLHINLIGNMQARDANGGSFLPRNRKTRALLAMLALAAPRTVLRQHLAARLWSQRDRNQARGSLRQSVYELQQLLGPLGADLLRVDRHHLSLRPDAIWLDTNQPVAEPERLLEDLAGLDPAFDQWLDKERRRLTRPLIVPGTTMPATAARRVRIGVAPFRSLDGDPEDALSRGLASEITTALARFRWMFLVTSPSLYAVTGMPDDGDGPWHALDLDFVLDGTVQRSGSRVRVMVRLLDARMTGEVVWAERFEPDLTDFLTLQDEIAAKATARLDAVLMHHESTRSTAHPAASPTAYDLVLRAVPAIHRLEETSFQSAGTLLAEAVSRDPDYAAGHAWFACWHVFLALQHWATNPAATQQRAAEHATRAMMLDPSDARGFTIAGHVRAFFNRDPEAAVELHGRALGLNPNLPLAWALSGLAYTCLGKHDEAIRRISRSRLLSPFDPQRPFFDMSLMISHLARGDDETALELGRQALALQPSLKATYKGMLAALGHLGRKQEAAVLHSKLLALHPGFCVREALARSPLRAEDKARYVAGLRLAGLRE